MTPHGTGRLAINYIRVLKSLLQISKVTSASYNCLKYKTSVKMKLKTGPNGIILESSKISKVDVTSDNNVPVDTHAHDSPSFMGPRKIASFKFVPENNYKMGRNFILNPYAEAFVSKEGEKSNALEFMCSKKSEVSYLNTDILNFAPNKCSVRSMFCGASQTISNLNACAPDFQPSILTDSHKSLDDQNPGIIT